MSDDFFRELQDGFLQEAQDLLSKVEALSLDLEKNPNSPETFAELARLAHNFKGSGKAVGFEHISKLGHKLEDFILAIKSGTVPSTPGQIDFLFKCLDRLKSDIEVLIQDKQTQLDHSEIFTEIEGRIQNPSAYEEEKEEIALPEQPIVMPPSAEEFKELKEESQIQMNSTQNATGNDSVQPLKNKEIGTSNPIKQKNNQNEVLRIHKTKIDFLLEAFGEQVILQSTLEQCKFDIDSNKEMLQKTISQLTKLTFELQSHALALTMVQLGVVFTKLERAIRDAARMCDKKINIVLEGAETEVDKTLIDSLSDSLTHMVRNAVDHAIEPEAERLAVGKPAEGRVEISAKRIGGQLWIEIKDDGKGLDPQMIRKKAVDKGIIKEHVAAKLSDQESFKLIFLNGFSTKDVVSEVSGRGVGMNVVEESVTALKGAIDIDSEIGKGTCFRLKLPLSLAIFNGAVVRVNDSKFVVPSSDIAEVCRVPLKNQITLGTNKSAIKIRDEIFELIDLRKKFKVKSDSLSDAQELPVLLSRKIGNKAFVVDEIIGMQKIVQKPLGEEVRSKQEYAAGTILGDGSPGIILNLMSFCQSA